MQPSSGYKLVYYVRRYSPFHPLLPTIMPNLKFLSRMAQNIWSGNESGGWYAAIILMGHNYNLFEIVFKYRFLLAHAMLGQFIRTVRLCMAYRSSSDVPFNVSRSLPVHSTTQCYRSWCKLSSINWHCEKAAIRDNNMRLSRLDVARKEQLASCSDLN